MEEWRAVIGSEGLYEVSSLGRVRSLPRRTPHYSGGWVVRGGRILKGCISQRYKQVTLSKDGRFRAYRVHTLVAEAFIGERPPGAVICHNDGRRLNNAATNLRYAYAQDNSDDMKAHGTVLRGETHGCAKLSSSDVMRIRALASTRTQPSLAAEFGVSLSQVNNILARRHWKHLPENFLDTESSIC